MRLKLLACEIFRREVSSLTADLPHHVDVDFLPMALHAAGRTRRQNRLAKYIADVDERNYDAVLLAYGLCSGGIVGLVAGKIPLVVPKAHDCITLFLGCRKRYREYFFANGGTYFLTAGWLEQENAFDGTFNGDIDMMPNYNKIAYISTGSEPDDSCERQARRIADERSWEYEKLAGDLSLLQRLIHGDWDEDFLIVPPGATIQATHNEDVIDIGTGKS
ncbi:MAG: DUF1638 domain-containing protein [Planctomycetaceae bacterium]|nr:DUF1638 domain-containing protein [Planctomycetaceae bacterium]